MTHTIWSALVFMLLAPAGAGAGEVSVYVGDESQDRYARPSLIPRLNGATHLVPRLQPNPMRVGDYYCRDPDGAFYRCNGDEPRSGGLEADRHEGSTMQYHGVQDPVLPYNGFYQGPIMPYGGFYSQPNTGGQQWHGNPGQRSPHRYCCPDRGHFPHGWYQPGFDQGYRDGYRDGYRHHRWEQPRVPRHTVPTYRD